MKKYIVTLANNDTLHVYRRWYDFWLENPWASLLTFRQMVGGKEVQVGVSKHFTIKIEEDRS